MLVNNDCGILGNISSHFSSALLVNETTEVGKENGNRANDDHDDNAKNEKKFPRFAHDCSDHAPTGDRVPAGEPPHASIRYRGALACQGNDAGHRNLVHSSDSAVRSLARAGFGRGQ